MSMDLKQLSSHLGLSPTTVSRALNGYADVSDATRTRVVQAAAQFGYRPNMAARRLALGRADAVGLVYPMGDERMAAAGFQQVLAGLAQRLAGSNIDLLLATATPGGELTAYERLVQGRRVDALVVPHTLVRDARIDYLRTTRVPFMTYGRTAQADDLAYLDDDHAGGARLAIQRLLSLGHKRIAYVHAPTAQFAAAERVAGVRAALASAGVQAEDGVHLLRADDRLQAQAVVTAALGAATRPTALLIESDLIGSAAWRTCLEAGVTLGKELSVIAFNALPADLVPADLRVDTVETATPQETGAALGEMVLTLIGGRAASVPQVLHEPVYVEGDTVGPAPH